MDLQGEQVKVLKCAIFFVLLLSLLYEKWVNMFIFSTPGLCSCSTMTILFFVRYCYVFFIKSDTLYIHNAMSLWLQSFLFYTVTKNHYLFINLCYILNLSASWTRMHVSKSNSSVLSYKQETIFFFLLFNTKPWVKTF